jgi:hypothetical protein
MPLFYSRRAILKMMGATPLVVAVGSAVAAQSTSWWGKKIRTEAGPKLFFSAADLPAIRRRWASDARFASLREGIMSRDRVELKKFLREEIKFNDPLHDIQTAGDRAQEMAFVYLMEQDDEAAELAIEAVRTIMKFPVWDFFLEGGTKVVGVQRAPSTTIAVSCVVDWLGDRVTNEERQSWLKVMAERGCEPCYTGMHNVRYPRETIGWSFNESTIVGKSRSHLPNEMSRRPEITQTTNLRAAPSGAMAIGAAAMGLYADDKTQLERWLEMTVSHFKALEEIYLPDGSYGEGVNYGNYTSESIMVALVALNHSGVLDLELDINWQGNVDFMLNLAMPTAENPYEVVNVSDNGRYRHTLKDNHMQGRPEMRTALPYWVAREYRDESAQWFGETLGGWESIWSLVFRDDSVVAKAPEKKTQTWYPDVDWVVARTGYKPDDLLVSLRSGVGYNHEHADRNSLIVKCFGEALIVDPMRPPYDFRDPSWLLRETAGHSAVLIDGKGHFYNNGVEGTNSTHAQARLLDKGAGRGYSYWTSDATQAYRIRDYDIRSVVRATVVCFDLPAIIVVDRVSKWENTSTVEARFFADNWEDQAKVEAGGDRFKIERPGAWAEGQVFSRETVQVVKEHLPIPEERAVQHPFVAVRTEPVMATTLVTVLGLGRHGDKSLGVHFVARDDTIEVTLERGSQRAVCRIVDAEMAPTIDVRVG